MPYIIESPFPSFNDTDGSPLNNGYVYVGSANLNPVTDPIPVYWDAALTQPAAQPIRTINGYLSRNGSPGRIYTNFITYSFRVTNNKGEQVFSDLNYTDPTSSAGSTYQQVITAIAGQTVFNLSRTYVPGTNNLFVYRNGLRLIVGQDYNETGYSQVTLTAGADNGDEFVFDIGYNYDSAASVDAQDVTYKLPAIDSVFTNVEAKLSETVSVKDFGAVGDGVTDDTAAIQAALNSLGAAGGTVTLANDGRYLIDSNLTINKSVSLVGPHKFTGSPGNNASAPYASMGGAFILNSSATITIQSGASLSGVLIYRKGMTFPAPDSSAYAGTAVTVGGDDASVQSCMILGFQKAVYSSGFQRPKLYDLQIDSQNGIEITACYDIPRIENVQCWPFATIAAAGTLARHHRSGSAFYLHDSVDGAMLSNCFSYGYLNGFYLKNVAIANASNCVADNTTLYNLSSGWRFEENINGFNCSSGASYSCGNGIVVNTASTQFVPIHNFFLAGHTYNAVAITLGHADVSYNYITTTPTAISIASGLSVVKFDFNTLATISTNFVYSSAASTTNTRIGANNFIVDASTGSLASGTILSPGVTSADPLQIPNLGEVFNVVGTTGFGNLAGGWANRKVTLIFTGALTVFSGTGAASNMRLNGNANFAAVANSTLTLQHNGTQWYEIGRSA